MPQTCTICRHPEHAAIDAALALGTPLRTIADQYGVSKTALLRHKQHAKIERNGAPFSPLVDNAQRLHQQALMARDLVSMVQTLRGLTALLVQLVNAAARHTAGDRR